MIRFMYMIILAIIVENMVFARALETSTLMQKINSYDRIIAFGSIAAIITTLSGMMSWGALYFLRPLSPSLLIRNLAVMLCIVIVYGLALLLLRYTSFLKTPPSEELLVSAAFSVSTVAAVFLALSMKMSLLLTAGYCFGAISGMTAAMLLVHGGRQRMTISNVPRAFEGMPITLIYIGIISMAIYGLVGYQIPA